MALSGSDGLDRGGRFAIFPEPIGRGGLGIAPDAAEALCRAAGIDPKARAEQLETAAFVALATPFS